MTHASTPTKSQFGLTPEQEQICRSTANLLLVRAFAGCGKTSTLVQYARRRPKEQFVYLAFNRAIKEEAAAKFPENVKCTTTHGLAYGRFGSQYKHKLGNIKPFQVQALLNCEMNAAGAVLGIVTAFLSSADRDITVEHAVASGITERVKATALVTAAKSVWEAMCDADNKDMPQTHDGYLKLFQLSNPVIKADCLLFDEAQDSNPLTLDIVLRQTCRKVLVGDDHQSIYSFRGSVNAMQTVAADESLNLTQSWRFGDGVGRFATALLKEWKQESEPVIGKGKYETEWTVDRDRPHAIIARTNAKLFYEAVRALDSGKSFGFVGGVVSYKFDLVNDAYLLFTDQRSAIKDAQIKNFVNWNALTAYADELDDKELQFLGRLVKEFGSRIPWLIERIKRDARPNLEGVAIVMMTAHRSKGLEYDSVILLDDFTDLQSKVNPKTGETEAPDPEEVNLLYVAATRALRCLVLPAAVVEALEDVDPVLYQEIMAGQSGRREITESDDRGYRPLRVGDVQQKVFQNPPHDVTEAVEDPALAVPVTEEDAPVSPVVQTSLRDSYMGSAAAGVVDGTRFVIVGADPLVIAKLWRLLAQAEVDLSEVKRVGVVAKNLINTEVKAA